MNIMAIKLAEDPEVRLPVMVAFDGYFTSHQKRRVQTFARREDVQRFIGEQPVRVRRYAGSEPSDHRRPVYERAGLYQ